MVMMMMAVVVDVVWSLSNEIGRVITTWGIGCGVIVEEGMVVI
jgi:hypothetical protein